jgi:hypothetical protein
MEPILNSHLLFSNIRQLILFHYLVISYGDALGLKIYIDLVCSDFLNFWTFHFSDYSIHENDHFFYEGSLADWDPLYLQCGREFTYSFYVKFIVSPYC